MSMDFADRVERVEPSATLAISNKASELEADGVDVVDLSVGEPDFDTPENIVEAGKEAMDAGHTGYTTSNGIPELRDAIAEYLQEDCGLHYERENVIVTPGGKQALFETFQSLIDDGDEVVLLDPAWVSYEAMVKLSDGTVSRVDTAQHDFQLEPALDDLEATVSDETELLVVNSPGNPHGAVYSEAALEGVRDLAVEHDVTVISDEIYREITYGVDPVSLGTLDGMEDRTVTINGFSKAYSMTGWRLGYVAAPEELIDQAGKLHSHSVSCAVNFVQHAGVEAIRNTDEAVAEMAEAFEERRDMLVDLLADHGVDVAVPDGAFYMMLPVDDDDTAWCEGAIEDAHVATVPGSAFGTPGYARISYANSKERLREAVDRLVEEGYL
ncbi:pyridoxal phosphate-dependent aminotransferase [Halostella sp. JP-L12]|uniref:pyridoxal phosphate-dependent aminotransferase n=1 Tax=Halostella TaxID=1843185 RepID=UPI000EF80682|nr:MULTISPECIES: pyridoxal phosphate-dependent aminotransferase [Halostella]NHN49530.1 pyridoxal phosphate-dependent aminotransferase [Halostella sp. JP-L12]